MRRMEVVVMKSGGREQGVGEGLGDEYAEGER